MSTTRTSTTTSTSVRVGWGLVAAIGLALSLMLVAPGTAVWSAQHWLGAGLMPRLAEVAAALPVPAQVLVTEEYPGAGPHTVLLIRPDGYVAWAAVDPGQGELREALTTWLGAPSEA